MQNGHRGVRNPEKPDTTKMLLAYFWHPGYQIHRNLNQIGMSDRVIDRAW